MNSRRTTTVLSATTLLLAGALSACEVDTSSSSDDTKSLTGKSQPKVLIYKVTGTSKASLTYTTGGTKTIQNTEAKIPFTVRVKPTKDALVYQLMAQNSDQSSKTVSCSISNGKGEVLDKSTGSGQFAIASCQWDPNE